MGSAVLLIDGGKHPSFPASSLLLSSTSCNLLSQFSYVVTVFQIRLVLHHERLQLQALPGPEYY